jgi:hypothetical protein
MRVLVVGLAAATVLMAAFPVSATSCREEVREAQRFVNTLRPGPNTRAAQRHLTAAKQARSARQCGAELRQVNTYAERSAAADRRRLRG